MKSNAAIVTILAAVLTLSAPGLIAAPDARKELIDAKLALEKAAYVFDRAAILAAREKLRTLTADATAAKWAHYYAALAGWQLHAFAVPRDRSTMGRDLQDCAASLRNAIALDSKFAEAHALLHRCLGEQIELDPRVLGQTLGPESSAALETAAKLDPTNPRVAILQAMATFYTPEAYGGSRTRGLAAWERALANFPGTAPADPLAPTWGLAEGWAWLGQMYMQMMRPPQPEKARAAYEKALATRPDFRWPKEVGLPATASP